MERTSKERRGRSGDRPERRSGSCLFRQFTGPRGYRWKSLNVGSVKAYLHWYHGHAKNARDMELLDRHSDPDYTKQMKYLVLLFLHLLLLKRESRGGEGVKLKLTSAGLPMPLTKERSCTEFVVRKRTRPVGIQ